MYAVVECLSLTSCEPPLSLVDYCVQRAINPYNGATEDRLARRNLVSDSLQVGSLALVAFVQVL